MVLKKLLKSTSVAILIIAATIITSIHPAAAAENVKTEDTTTTIDISSNLDTNIKATDSLAKSFIKDNSLTSKEIINQNTVARTGNREIVRNTTEEPYSGVCYIEATFPNGTTEAGTAFLIYDNIALTAGHCIYNKKNGGWAKTVYVAPGCHGPNASDKPYGIYKSKRLTVDTDWKNDTDDGPDYGVITLNSSANSNCYIFPKTASSKYLDNNDRLYIPGFPNPEVNNRQMYVSSGYADNYDSDTIDYTIDVEGGNSGSPILAKKDSGSYVAFGIHTSHDVDGDKRHGIRITRNILDVAREKHNQ